MDGGRSQLSFAFVVLLTTLTASAQHDESRLPPNFDQPIRLYAVGLGTSNRSISSPNTEARAYFNQGVQLMYAFAKAEAGRSFREAQRRDPECAICYWGEAWAWGPYVNGRMTAVEAPRAYSAIQKALALARRHASPKEQAFVEAMAVRYVEHFDPADHARADREYADAMARVAERYPDDADAATLYAEALFLLLPRPGTFDIADPAVARLMRVLEAVLARDIRHPGACHLYIHTTELTAEPERAAACAEHLGTAMPAASHLNHMPSHTWTRMGRWGDAVDASVRAWESDRKSASGESFATYPAHDLQMLVVAGCMDGQAALAIRAGQGLATLAGDPMHHALALVRFGRFAEIGALGPRPAADISGGVWDFAQGYARLRRADAAGARQFLARVSTTANSSTATFRFHPARTLLGVLAGILEGEIERTEGRMPEAVAAFEKAVTLDDALVIDDPEPLPFAARHWLGAALIDAGRFADAERVYRADLARHPHNGWSLVGLQRALHAQRKPTRSVDEDLRRSWARSDVTLKASRF
jgi:tetratricopeptide (TPR) repeat protein